MSVLRRARALRGARRATSALALGLASACLVRQPPPERAPPSAVHEVRRTAHPDGTPRREIQVLVWSDGRIERDGIEREFHRDGTLAAERVFRHDVPSGVWRAWYPDGSPRSEIDHGDPLAPEPRPSRYWHEGGALAAEGLARAGVREGPWRFWSESGRLSREGSYREGKRDGPWVFYDEGGERTAAGSYALGVRVGRWTLWDESGVPHERDPSGMPPEDP